MQDTMEGTILDVGSQETSTTDSSESQDSLSEILLARKNDVEDHGIAGDCTLLLKAAKGGFVDVVKWLIGHKIDVNTRSMLGNTPLLYGCIGQHSAASINGVHDLCYYDLQHALPLLLRDI